MGIHLNLLDSVISIGTFDNNEPESLLKGFKLYEKGFEMIKGHGTYLSYKYDHKYDGYEEEVEFKKYYKNGLIIEDKLQNLDI
jgi:hypothetical protein